MSCVNKLSAMLARACFLPLLSLSHIYANGFKIQEQSLNATALSSAYIAGARGADASYYNPANMGFSNDWGENKSEFELATSLINIPGFNFDVATTNQGLYSKTTLEFNKGGMVEQITDPNNLLGKVVMGILPELADLKNPIILEHSTPDSQIVTGGTGDTALAVPKMFYKSRTMHGVTFGGSFVASSGLAMQWAGKGGEFLQDVFIMMVEASPSVSWTINDRLSFGFGYRVMYAMGSFNNVVYVPLDEGGTGIQLDKEQIKDLSKHPEAIEALIPESIKKGNIGKLLSDPVISAIAQAFGVNLKVENCNTGGIECVNWGALMGDVVSEKTNLFGTSKVYQKSEGKDLSTGFRLAASLRVFDNGMASVVYNSPVKFDMKGKVEATTYVGGAMGNVLTIADLNIAVQMPEILTLAYAHEFFNRRLRLEGVYERTFWSRGFKFNVSPDFANATYKGLSGLVALPDVFNSETLKNMVGIANFGVVSNMGAGWRDTNTFRIGATYKTPFVRLMASAAYDAAPSAQDKIGIPDSDGFMLGCGAKINLRGFDLGLAGSWTYKQSMSSLYHSGGLGGLFIYTASLGYRW
nr:outer membrane protein transport protein [Helicobacter canis]